MKTYKTPEAVKTALKRGELDRTVKTGVSNEIRKHVFESLQNGDWVHLGDLINEVRGRIEKSKKFTVEHGRLYNYSYQVIQRMVKGGSLELKNIEHEGAAVKVVRRRAAVKAS